VVQKLQFLTALKFQRKDHTETVSKSCEKAAIFIWQNSQLFQKPEILSLASNYLQPEDLQKFAMTCDPQLMHTVKSPGLQLAFIVENVFQLLKRLSKMKVDKKLLKNFVKDALFLENRVKLIQCFVDGSCYKEVVNPMLNLVNDCITSKMTEANAVESEFQCELVSPIVRNLTVLNLQDFPKDVKTIVMLCALPALYSILSHCEVDDNICSDIVQIVIECGRNQHGNELIFGLNWSKFFTWILWNEEKVPTNHTHSLIQMALQNVYISASTAKEFEQGPFSILCEDFSKHASCGLSALDFLVKVIRIYI